MNNKNTIWIVIILIVVLGAIGIFLMMNNFFQVKVCTTEAKVCPDGSSVGRVGPNCEFAACPESQPLKITIYCTNNNCQPEEIAAGAGSLTRDCFRNSEDCAAATASSSLKTKIDMEQNIEYQYLEKLPTTFIRGQSWPPIVTVVAGEFSCKGTSAGTSSMEVTAVERKIGTQDYCVKQSVDAAAGSAYYNYEYSTLKDGKLATIEFILQEPQCANYDDPQQTACSKERQEFNPDSLVTPIIDSLKITQAGSKAINIENVQLGQIISSPFTIKGQAQNKWFFEGVFPIILKDASGKEIVRTQARAKTDWTVPGFVPFEAILSFKTSTATDGKLIFQNDNPSGLPENQETFELPVKISK
jgi:hypothetical protein